MYKPKKYFNLDLHISVIQDVIYVFKKLFGDTITITNWSISGHNWVFGNSTPDVKIINQHTWRNINPSMITEFHKEYDEYLNQFDGFIVTHTPVFCLLFEKYGKPIIVVNSCRFNQPFCWYPNASEANKWLTDGLIRMHRSGQLVVVSNNKGDQQYLLDATNIPSIHIPSLCLYTGAKYNPTLNAPFVCYGNRDLFPPSPLLVAKPPNGYTWEQLYSFKGIVHVPYEISTMSLFEQYSAGVPIFVPSYEFYKECISAGIMQLTSDYSVTDKKGVDYWLSRADYYNTKGRIYYYSSFTGLIEMLSTFVLEDTYNRENEILIKWSSILGKC